MNMNPQELSDTIFRLRSLHGVYDRALMDAAEALVENTTAAPRSVFEALVKRATRELEDAGAFHGRWSLFSDDELTSMWKQVDRAAGGLNSAERDAMADEIEVELARRHIPVEGL